MAHKFRLEFLGGSHAGSNQDSDKHPLGQKIPKTTQFLRPYGMIVFSYDSFFLPVSTKFLIALIMTRYLMRIATSVFV